MGLAEASGTSKDTGASQMGGAAYKGGPESGWRKGSLLGPLVSGPARPVSRVLAQVSDRVTVCVAGNRIDQGGNRIGAVLSAAGPIASQDTWAYPRGFGNLEPNVNQATTISR